MRITAISDLHGFLPEIEECDLLLIAGDICPVRNHNLQFQEYWIQHDFSEWINNLPCDKVVMVAGNHDFWFEKNGLDEMKLYTYLYKPTNNKIKYLQNSDYIYTLNKESISIYGTPYCNIFGNWAFMKDDEYLEEIYDKVEDKYDIILSHTAPLGTSDVCLQKDVWFVTNKHIGNQPLSNLLNRLENCKWNIHGHLHSSNHSIEHINNIKVVNVSLIDEHYELAYIPFKLND